MSDADLLQKIEAAINAFAGHSLKTSANGLFDVLGYHSRRQIDIAPNTAAGFKAMFAQKASFRDDRSLSAHWRSVDMLFQFTGDELLEGLRGQVGLGFDVNEDLSEGKSYLFFAIDLAQRDKPYTRTELAEATREINKLFLMPAMVLFKTGDTFSIAVIDRRLNKRDTSKDVLEKVTLIKDIRIAGPHRAHLEILKDLSLAELAGEHDLQDFESLHNAWRKTLDSSTLNKRFYQDVANWFFWASKEVTFPIPEDKPTRKQVEEHTANSLIRLITRLIFVWFIKEKGLVPDDLFNPHRLKALLKEGDKLDKSSKTIFYKAILQNLFFATLNTEMGDKRGFRSKSRQAGGRDGNFMAHNLYRYEDLFNDPAAALKLFAGIPFLNGGLFECLDTDEEVKGKTVTKRIDGFSDHPDNPLDVPDFLFFGAERDVNLNGEFGTSNKRYKPRGLIEVFKHYKFTIEENTPIEEEVALDPELLGKVFENLLAAYNPETGTTARKQTGSFYTPREIVNYMVDESLIAYFEGKLAGVTEGEAVLDESAPEAMADLFGNAPAVQSQLVASRRDLSEAQRKHINDRLHDLLAYNPVPHQFNAREIDALIDAIDAVDILDPACGSGAFPMGVLHKLVFTLGKLDPDNKGWKERQRRRASAELEDALKLDEKVDRQRRLDEIEETFDHNSSDYGRKLYLIENCIFGVDIQPIAVQIAKLRFFISLVVDQKVDAKRDNLGIRPLPNLETKFVAANTLIGISRPTKPAAKMSAKALNKEAMRVVEDLREALRQYLRVTTQQSKSKWLKEGVDRAKEANALLGNLPDFKLLDAEAIFKNARSVADLDVLLPVASPAAEDKGTATTMRNPLIDEKERQLSEIRHMHFSARTPATKRKYRQQDEKLRGEIAALLEKDGWDGGTAAMLAGWDPYNQNAHAAFFDPEWMFGMADGFDIVIGNPPYIKEYTHRTAFDGLRSLKYYQGKMDFWYLFACYALDCLKPKSGVFAYIVTNNWVTNSGASILRNEISTRAEILKMIDFGDYKIFENADIQTMILICRKDNSRPKFAFDLRRLEKSPANLQDALDLLQLEPKAGNTFLTPVFERAMYGKKIFVFSKNDVERVLEKLKQKSNFTFIGNKEIAQGIVAPQDSVNKASSLVLDGVEVGEGIFVLSERELLSKGFDKRELQLIKPYYTTNELERYWGNKENKYWIIYTNSEFKHSGALKGYSRIKKHLDKFKDVITSDNWPYGLHRSRDAFFFTGEKVAALRKCTTPTFTFTDFDCYVSQTFNVIKSDRADAKYLAALLNSRLIVFWLRHRGKMQGNNFQIDKEPLLDLPINLQQGAKAKQLIDLVKRILLLKDAYRDANISELEAEIDRAIYSIYDLTEEEVRIIEAG